MKIKNLIFLILIIIVGGVLRLVFLADTPPSLNWDEVSHGYNAYSILKTGMDQWGQRFPVFNFRAYGDYPTTLNLYLTIPFVALLGLTEFAIRFPHALFGTLTAVSVYFLTFGVTRKNSISLFAAFLAAISPWYFFTSRFVLQSNLSVFLLITAIAFFVNREKNKLFLPFTFIFLTLTLFAYHTTRIFSPLFLVGATIIYFKEIKNKFVYLFIGLFVFLSAYILISPGATARSGVLFIVDQGAVNRIIEKRISSELPDIIKRLVYNRPLYFAGEFSKKYISYFSPQFLFLSGGTQYQFSLPGFGLSYPVSLPFFYIGIILLVAKSFTTQLDGASKNYRLLLLWLLLSPVPAALTNESYAVLRATTMLPLPEILASIGFFSIINWRIKNSLVIGNWKLEINFRWLLPLYILILIILSVNYLATYFTTYRENYSWSWQYGYKEVVNYVEENYDKYDKIIVTKKYGEPHEFLLFYLKYDPSKYLSDKDKIAFNQSGWWWVDRFDKFWFINDWQVKLNPPEISSIQQVFVTESKQTVDCSGSNRCLLVTSPNNFPPGWIKLKTVNFVDGQSAFEIYTNEI